MHSLLSLHAPARAAATDPLREVLMLQFLSLPVFQVRSRGRGRVGHPNTNPHPHPHPDPSSNANQDPAPWNVVWRAGELFPIDVGDGATYDGKWSTFAQKYIGAVNDCYRMSLRTLCGDDAIGHGDERYDACMGRHFGGLCPSSAPFPCLDGCNTSYQLCAHLV